MSNLANRNWWSRSFSQVINTSYAIAFSAGDLEGLQHSKILFSGACRRLRHRHGPEKGISGRRSLPEPLHSISRVINRLMVEGFGEAGTLWVLPKPLSRAS